MPLHYSVHPIFSQLGYLTFIISEKAHLGKSRGEEEKGEEEAEASSRFLSWEI